MFYAWIKCLWVFSLALYLSWNYLSNQPEEAFPMFLHLCWLGIFVNFIRGQCFSERTSVYCRSMRRIKPNFNDAGFLYSIREKLWPCGFFFLSLCVVASKPCCNQPSMSNQRTSCRVVLTRSSESVRSVERMLSYPCVLTWFQSLKCLFLVSVAVSICSHSLWMLRRSSHQPCSQMQDLLVVWFQLMRQYNTHSMNRTLAPFLLVSSSFPERS